MLEASYLGMNQMVYFDKNVGKSHNTFFLNHLSLVLSITNLFIFYIDN